MASPPYPLDQRAKTRYQPVRWPVLETHPKIFYFHLVDLLSRLHAITEELKKFYAIRDPAAGYYSSEAAHAVKSLRDREDFAPSLTFLLKPPPEPAPPPTPPPQPPLALPELSELRDEVKAVKALIASFKPPLPPPSLPVKPVKQTFAAVTAQSAPLDKPRPAEPSPTQPRLLSSRPKARPRLVLRVNKPAPGQSSDGNKLPPFEITRQLSAALQASPHHSQVRVSAVKWTVTGNLVVTAGPDTTAEQLSAASDTLLHTLQPLLSTSGQTAIISASLDVKWSKIALHGVPTGVTDSSQAFSPADCHAELSAHNPLYRSLKITQLPSWVRLPSSYSPGSSSSLVFAFEDPDGTLLREVLASAPFYAYGMAAMAKRWKAKPANAKPPSSTPNAQPHQPTPTASTANPTMQEDVPMSGNPEGPARDSFLADTSSSASPSPPLRAAKRRKPGRP